MHRSSSNALDIKMEMTFDNEERSHYFGGDTIQGKVFLTSNQSHFNLTSHFRFAWTGTIQVQPVEHNKDSRVFFSQLFKLSSKFYKTVAKTEKGSLPLYVTEFIHHQEKQDPEEEPIILQKKKTIAITFKVKVPNDLILPSSTQTSHSPNKIIYLLEAFINEDQRPQFFCQRLAPIYEKIYTYPLMKEQKAEQSYQINQDDRGALRVSLPCLGSQAGVTMPVSVSIWNNREISRKQAIAVSLIRMNHVYANNRVFMSQPEKVHRVVTDLNLVKKGEGMSVQMIYIGLPIPKRLLPTITLESSQLMAVSYFVRVQVYAQQGTYQAIGKSDTTLEFMMVDLPFTIGTIQNSQPINQPAALSSPVVAKSFTDMSLSSASTNNDDDEKSKKMIKKKKRSKITRHIFNSGLFKKPFTKSGSSSTIEPEGSSSQVEEDEEDDDDDDNDEDLKTSSSVTLEHYEQPQLMQQKEQLIEVQPIKKEENIIMTTTTTTLKQLEQLTIDSRKHNNHNHNNRNNHHNIKPDNSSNNIYDIMNSSNDNNPNGKTFNMFYDEDSDDEMDHLAKLKDLSSDNKDLQFTGLDKHQQHQQQQHQQQKRRNKELTTDKSTSYFQMFPDSDSDE